MHIVNAADETPKGIVSKQPAWRNTNGIHLSGSDSGLPVFRSRGSFLTESEFNHSKYVVNLLGFSVLTGESIKSFIFKASSEQVNSL